MLRMGTYPARPPYGYKRVPISKDKTEIVVDEFASKVVQKAFNWYATSSFSMDLLRKKLKDEYGINWSKGFIDKVLKDHFYYGIMTWENKQYKHKYPPIISKEVFDQVQQIKAGFNEKRFKYAGKPYISRGLLRCGHCGLAVTPEKHKGHVYYHCTQYNGKNGAEWLREEDITEQLGNVFKRLKIPDWVLEQVVGNLNNLHHDKMDFHNKQLENLNEDNKTVTKMMDNLYIDKLKGRITDDDYDRYFQSFKEQKADIATRLGILQEAEDNYYITAKYLLELANRAYELFKVRKLKKKTVNKARTIEP